ncbi:hypothetical protein [Chitinimonas taiwanensis]|uniref:hypothetical protein n=1 Tax=Chitinimonas taiwanensis TaxID=240412 RepID=UPI0035B2F0F9
MATSARIKLQFILALIALYSTPCWAGCSDKFSGALSILDWKDDVPTFATLSKYEKGSNFERKYGSDSSEFIAKKLLTPSGRPYLQLKFNEYRSISHRFDYKLTLDNKIEFNIYKIEPTNQGTWGCSMDSAKVNNCEANAGHAISFEKKCEFLLKN